MSFAWMTTDGVIGPRDAAPEAVAQLKAGLGVPFRMYDDDDNLTVEGRCIGDWESEDGFIPLDGYGEPALGCTSIWYLNPEGKWTIL